MQYKNDEERIFGSPNDGQNEEENEEPIVPDADLEDPGEYDFLPPPDEEQRRINIEDQEDFDLERPREPDADVSDDPVIENVLNSQPYDRPRRGAAYNNHDSKFMSGRYIILDSSPVDGSDRNRIWECCLCQAWFQSKYYRF